MNETISEIARKISKKISILIDEIDEIYKEFGLLITKQKDYLHKIMMSLTAPVEMNTQKITIPFKFTQENRKLAIFEESSSSDEVESMKNEKKSCEKHLKIKQKPSVNQEISQQEKKKEEKISLQVKKDESEVKKEKTQKINLLKDLNFEDQFNEFEAFANPIEMDEENEDVVAKFRKKEAEKKIRMVAKEFRKVKRERKDLNNSDKIRMKPVYDDHPFFDYSVVPSTTQQMFREGFNDEKLDLALRKDIYDNGCKLAMQEFKEKLLLQWITQTVKQTNMKISIPSLQEKAIQISGKGYFKASITWVRNFINKYPHIKSYVQFFKADELNPVFQIKKQLRIQEDRGISSFNELDQFDLNF